jgi:L-ascorbate metabolism protein UlaG (beta-lactamase superfamily)
MKKTKLYLSIALCFAFAALAVTAHAATARDPQTFKSSAGPIKITPVMHASVLIEAGGKVIYVDPAKPGDFSGLPQADLILISHDHGDHVDHDLTSIKAISKADTEIWAPAAVHEFVTNATVMGNGEKKTWGKFTIEAVPAYNLVRGPAAGKFFHPKGVGNGYVITYGGQRLYFSGDTEAVPEVSALKNIDVAFICMNLPYTMTPDEAADLVKAFHPKVVVPYHYRANPATDVNAFKAKLEGSKIEVRMLEWYPKAS